MREKTLAVGRLRASEIRAPGKKFCSADAIELLRYNCVVGVFDDGRSSFRRSCTRRYALLPFGRRMVRVVTDTSPQAAGASLTDVTVSAAPQLKVHFVHLSLLRDVIQNHIYSN